ncbi:hypothetical protein KC953_02020 [Candidatus Saccharibacteria bacterium]|nr:hypothetical protein [Candidatus Saccharibacteria bacterium]
MSLVREFTFPDSRFNAIGHSHGLDPQTRLFVRLSSLVDVVQHITPPERIWNHRTHTYMWRYVIERRTVIEWEDAVIFIYEATDDFFTSCKRY